MTKQEFDEKFNSAYHKAISKYDKDYLKSVLYVSLFFYPVVISF